MATRRKPGSRLLVLVCGILEFLSGGLAFERCDVLELPGERTRSLLPATASENGVAGVDIASHQREKIERLSRYVSRPPVASERLALTASGQVRYPLRRYASSWRCAYRRRDARAITTMTNPGNMPMAAIDGCAKWSNTSAMICMRIASAKSACAR